MKENEAIKILENTFNNKFDENQYKIFIKNFLKNIDESDNFSYSGAYIPDDFKEYVKSYKRIGKFISEDETELDIIIVNLKKESLLEKNRTMQRNFIAKYLKKRGDKDFALVAYYSDDSEDWRFSFVRKEYNSEISDLGKIKIKEDFTPAKRFSFLVGKNEPNHTAKKQLLPILQLDSEPNFEIVEKAFNIESVTNEFFDKYKKLFLTLFQELENILETNIKIKMEFEVKNINISNFAKKLLGQIVFLYFLQKKGWLGIKRDENGNFKNWGSCAKDFLRSLFEKNYVDYDNFFNDILEPLFYEALATERENDYYNQLKCKIPFLNGGLFEPIENYNWQEVNIPIRDIFFKELFDTFDLYNFTVREDEPLEKEVAVDPEMLGKVFENLLEIKDRKSKGAFYTPREIVHYMCQESLINYLDTELNQIEVAVIKEKPKQENLFGTKEPEQLGLISKEYKEIIKRIDIEFFIKNGDFILQNDSAKENGSKSYEYLLSENIRKNAQLIDEKLANVKICDPAIGSGAFPVGMMTEIVKARNLLSIYVDDKKDRSLYNFKRNAIQRSIYGVDLDSSAVDIAKLRLWLSLIVDENEYKDIKPLPNLDYKIVCGNSLLNIEINALNYKFFDELEIYKPLFFDETNNKKKKELKIKIDSLINEITNNSDNFDYKVYFSEVFHYNKGFDIIIGNPPYVGEKNNKGIFKKIKESSLNKFYQGKMDLFYFFFHISLDIGKENAQICFITTNYFKTSNGGRNLRKDLKNRATILNLIDLNELKIFESALGQHNMITIMSKGLKDLKSNNSITKRTGFGNSEVLKKILNWNDNLTEYTNISQNDLYEGLEFYIRTYKSDNNFIDSILKKISEKNDFLGNICNIKQGIRTGADKVTEQHNKNYGYEDNTGKGIFVVNSKEVLDINLNNLEKSILKPWFKSSDIKKYISNNSTEEFVFYINKELNENQFKKLFPNIYLHLLQYKELMLKIRERNNEKLDYWFCLDRTRNKELFTSEKIIAPQRSKSNVFGYNNQNWYASADVYFIIKKDPFFSLKYILGLLNSKLYYFWLYNKGKRKGEMLELYQTPLSEIPIKKISPEKQKLFEIIVDYILFLKSIKLEDSRQKFMPIYFEQIINGMVYELYFEESLKESKKDILQYLNNLNPIIENQTNDQKLNIITSEFNILEDINHPVRNNLFFMNSIEEIRIIEGKK